MTKLFELIRYYLYYCCYFNSFLDRFLFKLSKKLHRLFFDFIRGSKVREEDNISKNGNKRCLSHNKCLEQEDKLIRGLTFREPCNWTDIFKEINESDFEHIIEMLRWHVYWHGKEEALKEIIESDDLDDLHKFKFCYLLGMEGLFNYYLYKTKYVTQENINFIISKITNTFVPISLKTLLLIENKCDHDDYIKLLYHVFDGIGLRNLHGANTYYIKHDEIISYIKERYDNNMFAVDMFDVFNNKKYMRNCLLVLIEEGLFEIEEFIETYKQNNYLTLIKYIIKQEIKKMKRKLFDKLFINKFINGKYNIFKE